MDITTDKKNLMATIYLKAGRAIKSAEDNTTLGKAVDIARIYNDSGVDELLLYDLSETIEEHERTLSVIKEINRILEIPSYAFGFTGTVRNIREYLVSGCKRVVLNSSDPELLNILPECLQLFKKDRLSLAIDDVNFLFKKRAEIDESFHDLYVFDDNILDSIAFMTSFPYYYMVSSVETEEYKKALENPHCLGVMGPLINDTLTDIVLLKRSLSNNGINVNVYEASMHYQDFNIDKVGFIHYVTQDYITNEVIGYGIMNEEAFETSMQNGKMHYLDPKTGKVIRQGWENNNFQYIKSVYADKYKHGIVVKVSQLDSSVKDDEPFLIEILHKDFADKNTGKLLETIYNHICERRVNPREGSYTTSVLESGKNGIAKKFMAEGTDLVLSAKVHDTEGVRAEISDLIFLMMIMMSEFNISWDDIMNELSQRK